MTFEELINLIDPHFLDGKRFKLMRHQFQDDIKILKSNGFTESEINSHEFSSLTTSQKLASIRTDHFLAEISCAEQGKPQLDDTDIVFAFAATQGGSAEFIGVFYVTEKIDKERFFRKYRRYLTEPNALVKERLAVEKYVTKLGYSKRPKSGNFFYKLKRVKHPLNKEFKNRVIVQWVNPIAWVQNKLTQEVLQIRAAGFVRDFPGYYDFYLSFAELKAIVESPEGNLEWENKLSAISGIYLILDTKTGAQYIGSAYGEGGLWGRWQCYSNTKHGGNYGLKQLVGNDESYAVNFQFSILRVMDKNSSKLEVIQTEAMLKLQLGTRVHGLNHN